MGVWVTGFFPAAHLSALNLVANDATNAVLKVGRAYRDLVVHVLALDERVDRV